MMRAARNVTMVARDARGSLPRDAEEDRMSYAEAKEIALLRLELRACWARSDRAAGRTAAARLVQVAGNDNELVAEARRWAARFSA
jgi:hypothetical protein